MFQGDHRASERPAGSGVHIRFHPEAFAFGPGVLEHLHPDGREERDFMCIVSLYAIDRGDLDAA